MLPYDGTDHHVRDRSYSWDVSFEDGINGVDDLSYATVKPVGVVSTKTTDPQKFPSGLLEAPEEPKTKSSKRKEGQRSAKKSASVSSGTTATDVGPVSNGVVASTGGLSDSSRRFGSLDITGPSSESLDYVTQFLDNYDHFDMEGAPADLGSDAFLRAPSSTEHYPPYTGTFDPSLLKQYQTAGIPVMHEVGPSSQFSNPAMAAYSQDNSGHPGYLYADAFGSSPYSSSAPPVVRGVGMGIGMVGGPSGSHPPAAPPQHSQQSFQQMQMQKSQSLVKQQQQQQQLHQQKLQQQQHKQQIQMRIQQQQQQHQHQQYQQQLQQLSQHQLSQHQLINMFPLGIPEGSSGHPHTTNFEGAPGGEDRPLEGRGPDGRLGAYTKEERQQRIQRFRAKKQRRIWRKQIKYDCRKRLADTRPRVKGRFVSRDEGPVSGAPTNGVAPRSPTSSSASRLYSTDSSAFMMPPMQSSMSVGMPLTMHPGTGMISGPGSMMPAMMSPGPLSSSMVNGMVGMGSMGSVNGTAGKVSHPYVDAIYAAAANDLAKFSHGGPASYPPLTSSSSQIDSKGFFSSGPGVRPSSGGSLDHLGLDMGLGMGMGMGMGMRSYDSSGSGSSDPFGSS